MSEFIDVDKDGKVSYEEWCNWIKSIREPFKPKTDVEHFFTTHSEFGAWHQLFFKLSKGSMDSIDLKDLKNYIRDNDEKKVIYMSII